MNPDAAAVRTSDLALKFRPVTMLVILVAVAVGPAGYAEGTEAGVVTVALRCKTILGKSPAWDEDMGRLHFVDVEGRKVFSFQPETGECQEIHMPEEKIGCVVPYQKQRLLVASASCIQQIDMSEGRLLPGNIAWVPEEDLEKVDIGAGDHGMCIPDGFRLNDGKCDPSGRFFLGSLNENWRDPGVLPTNLYTMVQPTAWGNEENLDGIVHQYGPAACLKPKLKGLRCVNGMSFWRSDPDGPYNTFYLVDSENHAIDAYTYHQDEGSIDVESRQRVVSIPAGADSTAVPNGMTIDSKGKLWVAMDGAGCVSQFDPETGEELQRVDVPVRGPTDCTFGGKDLEDLYITTRLEQDRDGAHEGSLLRLRIPGVRGLSAAWHFGKAEG